MSVCKICLCSDPRNNLLELTSADNSDKSGEYILLFCLGIQVIQGSEEITKFCETCFLKLAEFYQFKSLALQNEAMLSSLGLQKYIENDIKSEVLSEAGDDNEYDEPLIDCNGVINQTNKEYDVLEVSVKQGLKHELSDDEPISKRKKSRKIGLVTKEKHGKIPDYSKDSKETSGHVKPKVERKTFECAHCSNKYTSKKALRKHIKKNISGGMCVDLRKVKRFQCDLCPRIYHDEINLQQHINSVHTSREYITHNKPQCPICKKQIAKSYLQTHIKTKHKPETLPYKCDTCDRRFPGYTILQNHILVHTGVKPFSCDICDAKFRLKYSVALHKAQVHDKSKNHICHICSKRYFTGSLLQRHIRKHSKPVKLVPGDRRGTLKRVIIKTVECPDCGKPLASEKSLRNHRLLHMGQKYHCHICGLAFATRSYVVNHLKTHSQVRKFGCMFCKATFIRSSARRRHELEIHINKGEKKPPRKRYTRKNKCIEEEVEVEKPILPTVIVSVPGQSV